MPKPRIPCPSCGKRVKNLAMHSRAKHPEAGKAKEVPQVRFPAWVGVVLALVIVAGAAWALLLA